MNTNSTKALLRTALTVTMLFAAGLATAATTTVNLTAQRMTTTLPDGATVPMWGYCTTGSCTSTWAPGPTITVPAGNDLEINLTNSLPVPTSIVVLGQLGGGLGTPVKMDSPSHAPQTQTTWAGNGDVEVPFTPPSQEKRVMSFATVVTAASTSNLTWSNLKPGTYIYETGTLPSIQAPMGLYGVLVVTQAPVQADTTSSILFASGKAYPGNNANEVAYDSDTALLFSEIDPFQNQAVDAAAVDNADIKKRFDDPTCSTNHKCYPAAVNYTPTYFLINGQAYDKSLPTKSAFAVASTGTSSSGNVLLRLLNAGLRTHTPSVVGLPMALMAEDGNVLPGNPKMQNEVLLTAGKTYDVVVKPATSSGMFAAETFPVFDRQLSLSNANAPDGGQQGFLQVNGTGATAGAPGGLPTAVTPTVVNDTFLVPLNAAINGNVKLNDIAVAAVAIVVGTEPIHGTISFNPDGTFVYTPASSYTGTDTFTYKGNGGTTNTATVTLTVAGSGIGAAPTANDDTYTSNLSSRFSSPRPGVLANDSDPTKYPLTAILVGTGDCGNVTMNLDGSFSATSGGTTSCQFTYQAKNSQGTPSPTATATVTFGTKSNLEVTVKDPATGVEITDYRWIIQEDLTFKVDPTGTPAPGTPSLATSFHKSHMTVVATGCVGENSCRAGQAMRGFSVDLQSATLPGDVALDPNRNYYISILPGDAGDGGHAMGGTDIKSGWTTEAPPSVTINSNAYPWEPAQVSIFIYEDNAPVNGQTDQDEAGLGGFNIIFMDAAGRIGDVAGQQTFDSFGMPLSNALLGRSGCPDDRNTKTNGTATNPDGNIVGVVYTCPNDPNAGTPSADPVKYALAGHALVKNLTPARYDVLAHPGAERAGAGEEWWQTETLEGTQAQDAFTGVKEPVYFQEFGPPGFHSSIGFVNPAHVKAVNDAVGAATTQAKHNITGKITNQRLSRPSDVTLHNSGTYDWHNSSTCQVALNADGGSGAGIAIAKCDREGNFTLTGVPAGEYQMTIWDQWLDQIIQSVAVSVKSTDLAMGDIPVLGWFTQYDQNIFQDLNKNGKYDTGEPGISNVTMTTRYRDGGVSNQTATDSNGNGLLAELFPLFNWYVTEADTTRFKQTGVNVIVDGGGQVDALNGVTDGSTTYSTKYATGVSSDRTEIPGSFSYGFQGFIGQRNTINWGRTPYAKGENGGIQGTVVYSTTRPFDDQRYNVQTLWEPLVPRVTVNLYRKEKLADGTETLTLVDSTKTSSWDDFVNAVDTNEKLPDGITPNPNFGKQVNLQCPGQPASDPFVLNTLGNNDIGRCYDGWHNWNQVQAAPYDGRYQFPSAAYVAAHSLTAAQIAAGQTLVSLPPGQYVVETVTPPGFEVVKEEDKNILNGDLFEAPAVQQFGGIGNIFILPDQATLNNANPDNLRNADGIQNNATTNLGVTASWVTFPECVGNLHRVPDYLSLFPGGGLVAPFAGMDRPLCDRKLVSLNDQAQASATFFVFTEVPMAASATGVILDDATAEYYVSAPSYGEKAAVPFVPVSMKDFNGREISRLYSDQWGSYNLMVPSSWLVNPPTPSGYGPNMLISCMNDPGPIKDPVSGKMITDPQYNPAYSNFCYTFPYMPGRTTYLDTPVVPVAAYAAGNNPADCAYPDATPAIARVDSSDGFGPYVSVADGTKTLTITALGDQKVQNPNYAGPGATSGSSSQRTITRHYGFGGKGTVRIGNITIPVSDENWSDGIITATLPAGTPSGELVVTSANGKSTVDAVTVTVGGTTPIRVQGANGETIQAAIEAAAPGDLILVDAGTYNELVIMWKPVRLQGVGAASVIINAAKYPNSKLAAWRPVINSLFSVDADTGDQIGVSQVDPLPGQEITGGIVLLEPSVLATEQGAGITVLAKNLPANQCTGGAQSSFGKPVTDSNFLCAPSRIDGLSVTGGDSGGGIYVNGWAHNLEIANNRVYGNAGALNGGVRIGIPYLGDAALPTSGNGGGDNGNNTNIIGFGYDNNVKIHHNAITKNGTVETNVGAGGAGGGVSICSGSDGYSVDHNWVCGNYSAADGGGIGHIGYSKDGKISNNQVLFNQSLQQTGATHGGGIIVTGEPAAGGTNLSLGTGSVTIDSNIVRGNSAEGGHGGGIRLQQVNGADVALSNSSSRWFKATVTNNIIVNNLAGYAGGGISMADTLNNTVIDNNTIASNDSVGVAGVVVSAGLEVANQTANVNGESGTGFPSPAGISSEQTSPLLLAALSSSNRSSNRISNPELKNNIVWKNRSFYYKVVDDGNGKTKPALCSSNNLADATGVTCNQLAEQTTTGQCVNAGSAAPKYWDLGVVGDATAVPGANRLSPTYSILSTTNYPGMTTRVVGIAAASKASNIVTITTTSAHGFTNQLVTTSSIGDSCNSANVAVTVVDATHFTYSKSGSGSCNLGNNPQATILVATNTDSDPNLADISCNGSRETPEFASGSIPAAPKTMQAAATADEGNNYITVRFGPLYLDKPSGNTFEPFGDYHLAGSSPAIDTGTTIASVTHDFDGDFRPQGKGYEIGADEVALVRITPISLAFGKLQVGMTSAPQTVTLTNLQDTALLITSITIINGSNNGNANNFALSNNTCGASLAANSSCTINVTFIPLAPASATGTLKSASLSVVDDAGTQSVALSGAATVPLGSLSPTSLAFGNQQVNVTSEPKAITLANTGSGPLTVNTISKSNGQNSAGSSYLLTHTCGNLPVTLIAGASCTINVAFRPTSSGSKSGVTITVSGASGAVFTPASVSLSGRGVSAAGSLSTIPAFGNQQVGTTSAPQTLVLTNTSGVPLTLRSGSSTSLSNTNGPAVGFTNTNASNFAIDAATTTCTNGATILTGGTCTIGVTFTPSAAGNRTATVNVYAAGVTSSFATRSISGTGTAVPATVNPTNLTFGSQVIGTTSGPQTVTLSNPAGNPTMSGLTFAFSGNFQRGTGGTQCGTSLSQGNSCNVRVVFAPTGSAGPQSGSLTIGTTSAVPVPAAIGLSGTATTPAPTTVTQGTVAFPAVNRGSNGATQIVMTVNNPSGNPAIALSFALSGANPTSWNTRSGANSCVNSNGNTSGTLASGATCYMYYRFSPPSGAGITAGPRGATVTVTSGTSGITFTPINNVTLTGTAN